jgi:glycosyltransferase involved in cell wall biosynthesis
MHIVRYYPRAVTGDGGMSGSVRRWSESVAGLGARVTIAHDAGEPPPQDAQNGVRWVPVKNIGKDRTRYPRDLDRVVQDADLLVLHSGWTLHNTRAASVARAKGVPYMLEPRGAYDPHIVSRHSLAKRVWWKAFEQEMVHSARAIHMFFEEERPHLEALGYNGDHVIASNGIDAPPEPTWDGGSGGYVLWLGRFDPEHKGLDLLVDAAATLSSECPRILLHGPDWHGGKAEVQRRIERAGVANYIAVRDPVYGDSKRKLLAHARGFVYPSRWEACSNSVLEAVSLGVPTLTTNNPLGKWLARRGAAYAVDATVDALAAGLRELSPGPDAALVGKRGAEAVREELSWDAVARTWFEQVQELV